ncbi:diaminopimelate epimerase [Clostridium hydrogeniformans]|uniref:diaminopimelate epimerase n=1 Tax=Clostridium hydrogeniformans TaxID=349933 RepID=UPI000482B03A|nr:diaminopimelate epimerase [Clostridium hydrogeniformans]
MNFTKMHGNGNDFIVLEDFNNEYVNKESALAKKLCHRRFAIGADGILLVRKCEDAHIEMVIINSDGSYAAMCGNGLRCFVKYVYEKNICIENPMKVKTGDGIKTVFLEEEDSKVKSIKVNMGKPSFNPKDIPADATHNIINYPLILDKTYTITTIRMGVPHTVIFTDLEEVDIEEGKAIERASIFKEGTNVNFCEIVNKNHIKVKTWERGAGPTLACGTGNCASAFVANFLGLVSEEVKVEVQGGILNILIENGEVYMIGNAEFVCSGKVLINI